jgi:hypothetical protein
MSKIKSLHSSFSTVTSPLIPPPPKRKCKVKRLIKARTKLLSETALSLTPSINSPEESKHPSPIKPLIEQVERREETKKVEEDTCKQ